MSENFAVFILTNARPDRVYTLRTLQSCGYTGRVYLVVDNEDSTVPKYIENYGADMVRVFDKKEVADLTDEGDNFDDRRTITHARNACFDIAEKVGVKYFVQLDDDYTYFEYRMYKKSTVPVSINNLNYVFACMLDFYKSIPAYSIAFAQGGDFIGGKDNMNAKEPTLKRECMNSFFCSTDRPFKFIGRMNEDVNTYCRLGNVGALFFTVPFVALGQKTTQSNAGLLTEAYKSYGTYVKSFYTVMYMPSSVKVGMMGDKHERIHHHVSWARTVPVILSESYRKNPEKST